MTAVLFAHERPSVARAVRHVLEARGFGVDAVRDGRAATEALSSRRYEALVVDVALPGCPGYELIDVARAHAADASGGAEVVVLVASVFRKTSYKRQPVRLYGADDYVELHHLADMLPDKLARLLRLPTPPRDDEAEREATRAVLAESDARMTERIERPGGPGGPGGPGRIIEDLAALIVADVVLYNGDRLAEASTLPAARAALRDDLEVARDLLRQVYASARRTEDADVAVEQAFTTLMSSMGRREVAS